MLDNTKKELKSLSSQLESYLKSLIQTRGHNDSGNLTKSISISFIEKNGNMEFSLETAEYLKYLEEGKLLEDFLNYAKTKIAEVISSSVQKDLINSFKIDK